MRARSKQESGIALIVVMLLMLVFSVMMVGIYYETMADQKVAISDQNNGVAYYGAVAGIENLSGYLAQYFSTHAAVTPSEITSLTLAPYLPNVPGVTYSEYCITYPLPTGTSCPTPVLSPWTGPIPGNSPLAGIEGVITPFYLTVTADGPNNTEVKMTRLVQEVAVPVFEYGIFSDSDLSFHAGSNFSFGGRVHTNGNLFLAEDSTSTLTIDDKTTAYKDVIREQLSNGYVTGTGGAYASTVNLLTASGGCPGVNCRALGLAEGSVTGGPGSGVNGGWNNLSLTTYNGWILNGKTGAKKLNLALALAGGQPIAMIQRPAANCPGASCESTSGPIGSARFYNQASLRILLSDTQAAVNGLPGIDTTVQPYPLAEAGSIGMGNQVQHTTSTANYYLPAVDACHPPLAESPGYAVDNDHMLKPASTLLGGYIKIEMQLNATPGTWKDVTQEILSLGVSRDILVPPATMGPPTLVAVSGAGLAASTTYYYIVTALGPWGETQGTEASKATTSTNKQIKLTWSSYAGATGYRIYRGTSSGLETGYFTGASPYTDTGTALTASSLPTPCATNSIVHLEEAAPGVSLTTTAAATSPTNFIPINLYDPREGQVREGANTGQTQGSVNGIMNLVEIDVHNLQQWFAGTIGTSGTQALVNSGYILYVSDRRMNNNGGAETGEFGNEDIINPSVSAGTPNGVLDAPEDVDGDGVFRTYGATPQPIGTSSNVAGGTWPATISSMPGTNPAFVYYATNTSEQKNSVVIFRRALRLINGTVGNLPPLAAATASACSGGTAGGFTVATENPAYILGDYNASVANGFADAANLCHVPASVIADAVTLLSNNWTPGAQSGFNSGDANSFLHPTTASCGSNARCGSTTYYRMAVLAGKTIPFAQPAWGQNDTGTDGGVHNFLRYIEDWGGKTLNYTGSLASFFYSRQATGIYKYASPTMVYNPPTRNYNFDTDFQSISKLPPGTPRFTDVNALGYQQAVLANQ